jgi:serine protease Do
LKRSLNIGSGIQVSGIAEGKFKDAGIRAGYVILKVNDTRIESVNQLEKIIDDLQKNTNSDTPGMFITGVYPNGKVTFYAIDLSE